MNRARWLLLGGVVIALILAGIVSFYASSSPDGLERVATDKGFGEEADDHALADSPLADYDTEGVDNERSSVGVAGVAGTLIVLVIAGGVAYGIRRRSRGPALPPPTTESG
jgi:PDGLE domain